MAEITLSEINIFPVKSLGGISLRTVALDDRGLKFDRRWMLVDKNGSLITQREFPQMALVSIKIEPECLRFEAKGMNSLQVLLVPGSNEKITVQVWQDMCEAILYEKAVNDWFCTYLQTDCRLVFMPDETHRAVEAKYQVKNSDIVSFADAYPFLLIGENSLADLNSRLEKQVLMNRFRPSFVVKNAAAFAEDDWKQIKIGTTVFHVVKPCARCSMTTIDQGRGEFDGKEPLQTLARYRTVKSNGKNKVLFGQYLIAERSDGMVRVGDKVQILE